MIAALAMYDWPETRAATDAFWAVWRDAMRDHGLDAPDALTRDRRGDAVWRDPDLLVAQTCGWPFVDRLSDATQLVATPVYDVDGCEGPTYRSAVVARVGDPRATLAAFEGGRFARNGADSLSGWRTIAPAAPPFAEIIETGAHRASIAAVAEGRADLAAIDAICWALARRHDPEIAARVRVIDWTPARPGLPLITAAHRDAETVAAIRIALRDALADPAVASARAELFWSGAAEVAHADYMALAALGDA